MIDYTRPRRVIETYLSQNFDMVPVMFQNVCEPNKDDLPEYIEIESESVDSEYNMGLLTVAIYTPLCSGTERSRQIATEISRLISNRDIENVVYKEGVLKSVPASPEGDSWYVQYLFFEYHDETHEGDSPIC